MFVKQNQAIYISYSTGLIHNTVLWLRCYLSFISNTAVLKNRGPWGTFSKTWHITSFPFDISEPRQLYFSSRISISLKRSYLPTICFLLRIWTVQYNAGTGHSARRCQR